MSEEKYIAAIEISSSKIIAAVGRSLGNGQLEVTAIEQEKAVEAVRYGIIQNLEETNIRVARLLANLERRTGIAPRKITGVIAGLSGRSLRSIPTEVKINLPEETEITDDILARLRNEAMRKAIDSSLEVIDAVPRTYYRVGNTETPSPKGSVGNSIQATYDLIVCRPELKRNLTRTLTDKLGIRIEGFVVTALAAGHLILKPDEKRLGCMLVDMGAETTTVTIYRKGSLCYYATLPMGGRNITRDLLSLSLLEENAEDIKITSGNAMPRDTASSLSLNGVKLSDVSNLVVARAEEIVANIVEQMEYAGVREKDIPGGIVCIGGASRLQGVTDLLAELSNLQVRRGKLPPYVDIEESRTSTFDAEQVVSVMYAGATLGDCTCLEEPTHQQAPESSRELPENGTEAPERDDDEVTEEKKPRKSGRLFDGLSRRIASLFSGPVDNSDLMD